uniref:Ig-like domain-containing protein n=1 Tax=Oreochromis aureus TaxID=47969 RepID=A0AAZ1XIF1_OREAU
HRLPSPLPVGHLFLLLPQQSSQKNITADTGDNVILPCRLTNKITAVEWSRADLGDEIVFLYQDGQFVPQNQHPSFKNRVALRDRQMKDGDASLILKNVTTADSGTYKCRVKIPERNLWKYINLTASWLLKLLPERRTWKLLVIINLSVSPGE